MSKPKQKIKIQNLSTYPIDLPQGVVTPGGIIEVEIEFYKLPKNTKLAILEDKPEKANKANKEN